MNSAIIKFVETVYRPIIEESEKFCFIVRGIEFQKEAVQKLEDLRNQIIHIKTSMIREQDEDAANCCLSLEMAASTIQHELNLWICLKEDRTGDAWDELVSAELSADAAIRAHDISAHMVDYFIKLQAIEKLLFPPIIFMSPGYIILSSRCTICDSEYGKCDHLKGLPYMGEFCTREITEARIREISVVPEAANRHARMTAMTIDGAMRDLLTWREVSEDPHEHFTNLKK